VHRRIGAECHHRRRVARIGPLRDIWRRDHLKVVATLLGPFPQQPGGHVGLLLDDDESQRATP
jgi:hypothetical protein